MNTYILKYSSAFLAGFFSMLFDVRWLIVTTLIFIAADCFSAYQLSRRIRRVNPNPLKNDGKFATSKGWKAARKSGEIIVYIAMAYMLDIKVMVMWEGVHLANYVTLIFCVLEAWSILENASSCNGSSWAKVLQKIMIDKTERHLDIDLSPLIQKNEKEI